MRRKQLATHGKQEPIMANVTITEPKADDTLHNLQIPVAGTVTPAGEPVTVSLYLNNNPVSGQQNKQANVTQAEFHYTFTQVPAGSGYTVKATGGGRDAVVTGLTVTA
jgi:hypothetical protein